MRRSHFLTVAAAGLTGLALLSTAAAHPGHDQPATQPAMQPAAQGAINAGNVSIVERDGYRFIRSNGLPGHETGEFPSRGNPNAISPQQYAFRVPLEPQPAAGGEQRRGGRALFGVAINGVPFDPGTAEIWRDGRMIRGGPPREGDWNQEAIDGHGHGNGQLGLDANRAHVQPTGAYHYHGVPWGLIAQLNGDDRSHMLLVGWAADGFPIYAPWGHAEASDAASEVVPLRSSYQLREGERPDGSPGGRYDGTYTQDYAFVEGSGELDELNGREGVTPKFPGGTYYYVVTEQFPFVARQHRGPPDPSFQNGPAGGPGGQGGTGGPGDERGPRGNRPPPRR